jgi:DNA-binding transcriptional regulator YhcF (GntR family)
MAQQQVAGSIILDQLRDRIVTGLFLGSWQPGERLPSIRDVAGVEQVDRKTAAAAYRRLFDATPDALAASARVDPAPPSERKPRARR